MKKVELLITLEHPKGNIEKGSIYNFNADNNRFEYKQDGKIVGTIHNPQQMPSMFRVIN